MKLWCVQGTKTSKYAPWTERVSIQIPTFYLDPNVQGILDEAGAQKVARDICGPGCEFVVVELDV